MDSGKAWTVLDRYGNEIYLTWERWEHIIEPDNHPEVERYFDYIAETIRLGRRQQDASDPSSYRYNRPYPDLPGYNSHLVVCARFRWQTDADGTVREEKFVTTAYFQFF